MTQRSPCSQCGAWLEYQPGTTQQTCPYCGHDESIEASSQRVEEQDFLNWLEAGGEEELNDLEEQVLPCGECGATTTLEDSVVASTCAYCGHPLTTEPTTRRRIPPTGLLPFEVDKKGAREALRRWLASRWFAPSALKKQARSDDPLHGLYTPYWTFDADTDTTYRGQRGDDYWVTVTSTVMVNGKPTTQSRQERRTRWTSVSGRVRRHFDDVLVIATTSLPQRYTERLEPWDLHAVKSFDRRFLQGFRAETYRVPLRAGFAGAREKMSPLIDRSICNDIGGDHQRISSKHTRYDEVHFKHLLLPIWLSTYRYRGRPYRFLVNGRTGEVQGARPYSFWKIAGAVGLGLFLIGGLILLWHLNAR